MKQNLKIKCLKGLSVVVATFLMFPCVSFADGEDVAHTVKAFAETGSVAVNVGNVNVTDEFQYHAAAGISATAVYGYTSTVNAKNVTVRVDDEDAWYQTGVDVSCLASGKINITTDSIDSKDKGIDAFSDGEGSEVSITVNGNVIGGIYGEGNHEFIGIAAFAQDNGKTDIVVKGSVYDQNIGINIFANGRDNKGNVNVTVDGAVIGSYGTEGIGLSFFGTSDTSDVLVKETIMGGRYGVNTSVYNQSYYHPEFGTNNLTVWRIFSATENINDLVVKETAYGIFEPDDDFAKKIKYIIEYDQYVVPVKEDGSVLDTSHGRFVAKEGDRVFVEPAYDGIPIKKVFNNGVEVTTKDETGRFYIDVQRGGGVYLTAEVEKLDNPITLKGKTLKVKASVLSKKKITRSVEKAIKITNAKCTLFYQKVKGKKRIVIDPNTGTITIKRGLKKGTYRITSDVTASGDDLYKLATKKVLFTLNVG